MDIGEVIRQSGLPASTLRYYEERGLIRPLGRRGQRRIYGPDVLERLSLIALGRTAGFSLDDIAQMFAPDGQIHIDRSQLLARAEQIEHTITRLQALSNSLRHAAACPAPSHLECPSFQRLLREAALEARRTQKTDRDT